MGGINWFDYDSFYKEMVDRFNSGSHFVEVGCHVGRSSSFMAVEIINSGKDIRLDCVDWWNDEAVFNEFKNNIEPVKHRINIVKEISWDAAKLYEDGVLDFVFIDASHDFRSVYKDIKAWKPKVRIGGILAGHDYNPIIGKDGVWVSDAVHEFIGEYKIRIKGSCWVYEIP
jgi:predicted O-methyltransferase YrrM